MTWEDIAIGVLVLIVLYLLFRKTKEGFENNKVKEVTSKEYYQQLCDKTVNSHNDVVNYLKDNCSEEKMDELKNFRNSINNRNWCRLKNEEEITTDINKDTWCNKV
jgi:hypothetical protein